MPSPQDDPARLGDLAHFDRARASVGAAEREVPSLRGAEDRAPHLVPLTVVFRCVHRCLHHPRFQGNGDNRDKPA
jgi:hypothetical protein